MTTIPGFASPRAAQASSAAELPAERVGSITWWSAYEVKVAAGVLRDSMRAHCPQHVELVREPVKPRTAMRRAMARRQGANLEEGWRWEEVSDDAGGLCIALAEAHRDAANQRFTASTRFTVLVDDHAQITWSRVTQSKEEADALRGLTDRFHLERGFLTHSDLRDLMTKVLRDKSHAVRVKDGGAVYFVPKPHDEVIDQLTVPLKTAGIDLLRFPVLGGDRFAIGQLTGAATRGISEEIDELLADVSGRLEALKADEHATKATTFAARLNEASDLRAKAKLFEALLGCELNRAHEALQQAERACREAEALLIGAAQKKPQQQTIVP